MKIDKVVIRKILFIIIWYIFYPNFWFFLIIPDVYRDFTLLSPLLLFYLMGILDTIVRPIEGQEKIDKYSAVLLLFFFIGPIILILAYFEFDIVISNYIGFLFPITLTGILFITIGGFITLIARIQLKKYATGVLMIQEDHKLINTGLYKYIRHPIYTGSLVQIFGLYLAFHSFIILILTMIVYFWVFNGRANYEEELLEKEFGEDYSNYERVTKKMVPFLY